MGSLLPGANSDSMHTEQWEHHQVQDSLIATVRQRERVHTVDSHSQTLRAARLQIKTCALDLTLSVACGRWRQSRRTSSRWWQYGKLVVRDLRCTKERHQAYFMRDGRKCWRWVLQVLNIYNKCWIFRTSTARKRTLMTFLKFRICTIISSTMRCTTCLR